MANTPRAAARAMAGRITVVARQAMGRRGVCNMAFSGGAAAPLLFAELVNTEIFWGRVNVFQVDERVAPDGSPDRNATALVEQLAEQVGLPQGRLHLMEVGGGDATEAARRYQATLPAQLDVVHLGLGTDGHTASWAPGAAVLEATDRVVAVAAFNGFERVTLTPVAVNEAEHRLLLVTGADKAAPLARLLAGDQALPASRLGSPATVYADGAAAAQ